MPDTLQSGHWRAAVPGEREFLAEGQRVNGCEERGGEEMGAGTALR